LTVCPSSLSTLSVGLISLSRIFFISRSAT
jgi:hypothetical protein